MLAGHTAVSKRDVAPRGSAAARVLAHHGWQQPLRNPAHPAAVYIGCLQFLCMT